MIGRIHSTQGRTIFSLCDDTLIDQRFDEGDKQLDLTSDFFKGEPVSEGTTVELIARADILFVVGEESIKFATIQGIIKKNEIKKISGIPYAQIVRL